MKSENNKKNCVVVGAGVSGLSAAALLANKGYSVVVIEQSSTYGGKVGQLKVGKSIFDTGPSLCTDVYTIDSVYHKCGKNPRDYWNYTELSELTRYFWLDENTSYIMPTGVQNIQESIINSFNESPTKTNKYFNTLIGLYHSVSPYYIDRPLKLSALLNHRVLISFIKLLPYVFKTQNKINTEYFNNLKTRQILNRYATYSGSNPYKAPAVMGFAGIPEIVDGAYFPEGGMRGIVDGLNKLCLDLGVEFKYSTKVEGINIKDKSVDSIKTNKELHKADEYIFSIDNYYLNKILSQEKTPTNSKDKELSTSAFVFYWEVKGQHDMFGLHNILFSNDYEEEYKTLSCQKVPADPTLYINITSKKDKSHASKNTENWFVMVNVPAGTNNNELDNVRHNVINKISKTLNYMPEVINEDVLTPTMLDSGTGAWQGAIYGQATNSLDALLNRPKNKSKLYNNLYQIGGTVHPGGGIPLAIRSAIIAVDSL